MVAQNARELTQLMLVSTNTPPHLAQQVLPSLVAQNTYISEEHDKLLDEWRRTNQAPNARSRGAY
ncbi:hypothetical protein LPJ61_004909, partial [Coemansia biformis]